MVNRLKSLVHINNYLPQHITSIKPAENSHNGLFVPEIVFKYGKKKNFLKNMLYFFPCFA